MSPHFDQRPWGARDLAPIFDRRAEPDGQPVGEAWLTWDQCCVANGPLQGKKLGALCRRFGRRLVGRSAPEAERFPLLVKFLFPCDKLSVQVHPDDETARRLGEPCGKTECWYIVRAQPGAQVALGLKSGTSRRDFARAIEECRAEALLNWVEVGAGDMIYVDAGTVHTLGPGSIIVETQQNSDTTYRLYDYGRPRELHIQRGLEATKEHTQAGKVPRRPGERLISAGQFVVDKISLEQPRSFAVNPDSAQILVAIAGCGVVEAAGAADVTFACGSAVVIPAETGQFTIRPQWQVEFLRAALP
jgi:mannose-6-phosphate isomerase